MDDVCFKVEVSASGIERGNRDVSMVIPCNTDQIFGLSHV